MPGIPFGMRSSCISFVLGLLFFSITGVMHAAISEDKMPASPAEARSTSPPPELAEIIPMAGDLARRFADLEKELHFLPDVSAVEREFDSYQALVARIATRLVEAKQSNGQSWARSASLSRELDDALSVSRDTSSPLTKRITLLSQWLEEWRVQEIRWQEWEAELLKHRQAPQIRKSFATAKDTIDTALQRILQQLEADLQLQARDSAVWTRLHILNAEIKSGISERRRDQVGASYPPMFTAGYWLQFRGEMWHAAFENIRSLSWPHLRYFSLHGWVFLCVFLLFLASIFSIFRHRELLQDSEHWQFIASRPFATSTFVVTLIQLFLPAYQTFPTSLRLLAAIIGGISFVRILRPLVLDPWKRHASSGVILYAVTSAILEAINLPLPLYRLYTFLASLVAAIFLMRWASVIARLEKAGSSIWVVRAGWLLFAAIMLVQLLGNDTLASYMFDSTVSSLAITLAFTLFLYMIRGILRWFFYSSAVWSFKQLRSEAELLSRRSGYLVEALIIGFVLLPILLTNWGVYASVPEATGSLLEAQFAIGSERLSVGLILAAAGTLYGSLLLSWFLPRVLLDEKVAGANMERGVRISVGRLLQYFIVFVGFLGSILIIGFDLTKITIILSALGVGVGFGMQGLVNNFISGLILLVERPVRVGDSIEISGKWAEIKRIGLRSTTVQSIEKADIIIPNANLISNELTNWTLSNRQIRLSLPVGVAYGSDIGNVMDVLLASAAEHDLVAHSPSPQVLFLKFGESSLDFELRVWITDADDRLQVISDLHREIDRRFRDATIEIAFPQIDVHIRSIDKGIASTILQA